ncbi:MAG: hypothetical protein FJ164_11390 [Gammaproteobacteria bacterium]|nr:hypothetical protein [Gammaproteobacteria bacterium]
MTALVLLLPGVSLQTERDLRDLSGEYPRLAQLLGRARRRLRSGPFESSLLSTLGLPAAVSLAGLTALADFKEAPPTSPLLRSDPLYLHADPNKVLVQGRVRLEPEEAMSLLATLNAEFPELDFRVGRDPGRWYVRQPPEVSGKVPSRHWLHGRSLTPFMPRDAADRQWRRYLNDLQMVLHVHPVNEARVARGALPLNAVWWFGGGEPPVRVEAPVATRYLGNDILLAGIARATGQVFNAVPAPEDLLGPGRVVMTCDEHGDAFDPTLPAIGLAELENRFLPVIRKALLTRRICSTTVLCGSHELSIGWLDSMRFWRALQRFHLE